ncbi:hypothetical protein MKZ38_004888 [Zalerion maritima]|uniref:Large ribosomal subunit protein mL46 n=1 Tax=Zalerion maritima TaxID=339359 RepID=A0AAD5WXA3_9PEZI|nr:hypothetical protein MKZ38_004888 [Zalerion maritima]
MKITGTASEIRLQDSLSALVNDQDVLEVETGLDDKEWCLVDMKRRRKKISEHAQAENTLSTEVCGVLQPHGTPSVWHVRMHGSDHHGCARDASGRCGDAIRRIDLPRRLIIGNTIVVNTAPLLYTPIVAASCSGQNNKSNGRANLVRTRPLGLWPRVSSTAISSRSYASTPVDPTSGATIREGPQDGSGPLKPPPTTELSAAEVASTTAPSQASPPSPQPDLLEPFEPEDPDDPPLPKNLSYPIIPTATHTLFGGMILTRPPLLTRALTPFEDSFFLYQKRLNERLSLPFMPGLYFKSDMAPQLDWSIKIRRRRMVPSREIGYYQKRGREAWNDEELVGSKLASSEHIYATLLKDSEALVNDEGERIKKEDVVPAEKPMPRLSEADLNNDTKRLDRKMDRTLYLIVKDRHGDWRFPHAPIAMEEAVHQVRGCLHLPNCLLLHWKPLAPIRQLKLTQSSSLRTQTAARSLREHCGMNMNTWMVGRMPVAHMVTSPTMSEENPSEIKHKGKKIFFLKGRIMAGQADIGKNTLGLKDFLWLTREELKETLHYMYFRKVKNMMADR